MSPGNPTGGQGPSRKRHLLLLCLLILVHLANSALVISRDRYFMVPDALDYFQWSVSMAQDLQKGEVAGAAAALWGNRQRSPLGIIPATLSQLGGTSQMSARLSSLFWMVLLLYFTFRVTERLSSPGAGLLAAASLAAMPMVMGFSRLLWLDLPLAAMTAWCVLMLLRAEGFHSLRGSLLLGVVVGLGLLTKYSLPIFVGPPALCFLLVALRRGGDRLRVLRNVALSVGLAAGVFALWAGFHLRWLIKAFEMARPGLVILEKPEVGAPDPSRFTYYLERIPQSSLGPLLALLMAAGFAVLLVKGRRKILTITTAWFWGAMLLLAPFVTWDRYFLPALPAAAVLIGAGLCQIPAVARRRRWAVPTISGLLALLAIQQSWFGPVLARCGDAEGVGPSSRVFCSGMIRPITTLRARLDMSQLEAEELVNLAVLPNTFLPDPAPAPYDRPPDAVRQWLIEDTSKKVEVCRLADLPRVTARTLLRFRLVAVLVPAPPYAVPPRERGVHRRVRRWLDGDPKRWARKIDVTVTDGTRLLVYRNQGEMVIPRGEKWHW